MTTAGAEIAARLRDALGERAVLTAPADVEPYAVDWRGMFTGKPACVVRPGSTAEVSRAVAICREADAAIVPQGGNTGLAGGAVPDCSGRQVVLSLNRMRAIRAVDPVGMTVEAEAGTILKDVQSAAEARNRLLPISLAAEGSATIGGVVATNAGGLNVLRYGMTRSLVLGLEVVLPNGAVLPGLRHLRKDNAGYDWKQLFIGTEGTLGIVTAAVLRLVPRQRHRVTALLSAPDPAAAVRILDRAQDEIGEAISAFELISRASLDLVRAHVGLEPPIAAGEWFVLMEAQSNLGGLSDSVEAFLEGVLAEGWAIDGVVASSAAQAAQLWALRENITEAEGREGRSLKHDVSLPLGAIPAFLSAADIELQRIAPGCRANVFGHLGDGNLHFNLFCEDRSAGDVNRLVHDFVTALGGSISAEHGIGQYRTGELARLRNPQEQAFSLSLKNAIDPRGLLNPAKVFPRGDLAQQQGA